jgi:hypothetical protein
VAQYQHPQRQQPPPRAQTKELTPSERSKIFVDHIAPKLNLTKGQKDSLTTIFAQYIENVEKYRAGNNPKVISFMEKIRDDKIKTLLCDEVRFEKYLSIMGEMKNQGALQQKSSQEPQEVTPQNSIENGHDPVKPQ